MTYDDAVSREAWDSNKTALNELNCRLLKAFAAARNYFYKFISA